MTSYLYLCKLSRPLHGLGTGHEFIARYEDYEIRWYKEIAQTIFPRGYNTLQKRVFQLS